MLDFILLVSLGALVVIGLAHAFSGKPSKWSHYDCPHCAQPIRHTAVTCPFCRRDVGYRGA